MGLINLNEIHNCWIRNIVMDCLYLSTRVYFLKGAIAQRKLAGKKDKKKVCGWCLAGGWGAVKEWDLCEESPSFSCLPYSYFPYARFFSQPHNKKHMAAFKMSYLTEKEKCLLLSYLSILATHLHLSPRVSISSRFSFWERLRRFNISLSDGIQGGYSPLNTSTAFVLTVCCIWIHLRTATFLCYNTRRVSLQMQPKPGFFAVVAAQCIRNRPWLYFWWEGKIVFPLFYTFIFRRSLYATFFRRLFMCQNCFWAIAQPPLPYSIMKWFVFYITALLK